MKHIHTKAHDPPYVGDLLFITSLFIMKKIILGLSVLLVSFLLVSCGSEGPLTEAEQAAKYNMTVEEFRENKDAAARMNMTIEQHLNMDHGDMDGMDHGDMQMDDSHMIEDDADMDSEMEMEAHMDAFHEGQDIEDHKLEDHDTY